MKNINFIFEVCNLCERFAECIRLKKQAFCMRKFYKQLWIADFTYFIIKQNKRGYLKLKFKICLGAIISSSG